MIWLLHFFRRIAGLVGSRCCGLVLSPVCDECVEEVQAQTMTLCRRCGEALDMEGVRFAGQFPVEGLLCSPCRMAPPEFERAVAYAAYEDELREMVHLLKYERVRGVAGPLGRMLARAVETLEGEAGEGVGGGGGAVVSGEGAASEGITRRC